MDFNKNSVALMLDAVDEEDEHIIEVDDKFLSNFDPVMKVDIDLGISA
jgi:hypothetical protein